jgi:hypothetical protein
MLPVPGTDTEDFLNATSAILSSLCLHNIHPPTGIDPGPCLGSPALAGEAFAIWATPPRPLTLLACWRRGKPASSRREFQMGQVRTITNLGWDP